MAFNPEYYIHENDRAALKSLQSIPGFSSLLKKFMKEWSERQGRLRSMSSYIRINEDQLPQYSRMLEPICEKLGIDVPELYLTMDVRPNAYTYGETKPFIVITSGLLDTLPDELIPTVLAHECGHIACHHVLYRMMGNILFGTAAGTLHTLPFGSLISLPLQVAFFHWMRCSEYSADRAAVLVDGSADKMTEVCMRLAGFSRNIQSEMNREAFMEQAREYRQIVSESNWDKTLEFYMLANATHPFMAVRALECNEWAASEQFASIVNGTYKGSSDKKATDGVVCPSCGEINAKGSAYCRRCGTPLENKVCPNCGSKLDGSETFCPDCGYKLIHDEPAKRLGEGKEE